jgi:hypothetical protein
MDLLFGLQIAAIFLALLAHFTSIVRGQLFGPHTRTRQRLFSGGRTGLSPELRA